MCLTLTYSNKRSFNMWKDASSKETFNIIFTAMMCGVFLPGAYIRNIEKEEEDKRT